MDVYKKLKALGIEIDSPPPPGGIYRPVVEVKDKLVFTSGNGCAVNGHLAAVGKVGREVTLEQAQLAARVCSINILRNLNASIGDLNSVKQVVKMLVFVASDDSFFLQPQVANAASALMAEVFGDEDGKAARSAIGVNVLPNNMPVEIEMVFELK